VAQGDLDVLPASASAMGLPLQRRVHVGRFDPVHARGNELLRRSGVMHAADVHIGTSGWHYRHWVGRFYPLGTRAKDFLDYYARQFRTVEINATFYRLPSRQAVIEWRDGSPPGFVFAAKGSRFVTHMKKLRDPETSIRRYFDLIELLGDKLGPVVFQLPPRWHLDLERLGAFLKALPKRGRYAFELRDETWWSPRTYELLARHEAALCLYDLAGRQSPLEITADFVYIRLHGPGAAYRGSYDDRALASWAERLRQWRANGITVYCYFDNDEQAHAPMNALRLERFVREPEQRLQPQAPGLGRKPSA
jgi:uncharacterized protein YecE (DUF72 family)